MAEACQNQWSHVGLCQRDSLLEMMQENRFLEENPKRLCCLHLPLGNPSHFTAITHWKHSSKTKELRKIQTLHINSRQSDQMNVQRFPKLGEVIWPLSPRATGVNPYWIGDMDCTTPRKAVPFRERQPHALHTNRKSLSQQLDCSGGRTPVSAMGNHQRVHSWSCTDIFLLLGNFSCSQHYVKLISLFAC